MIEKVIIILLCLLIFLVISDLYLRLRKKRDKDDPELQEEIISMVNEGHEQGMLETNEAAMINNIFDFDDKEAGDIMTNRSNVVAIDKDTPFSEAISFMLSERHSRFPVFEENLDHIVGILYLKDAMRFRAKDENFNGTVGEAKNLVRKAMVVLETTSINDLFKMMQSKKIQLAIVVDEYGQTVGLISMEDILEEIVGNIMDEYDVDEKHIRGRGKDSYIVDGLTPLSEIEEALSIELNVEDFETLNGFMISRLDRLPEKNETFTTEACGYSFSILKVENRMISKVSVKKIEEKKEEDN